MSPLVPVFLSPSVSELPDVDRKPPTNPSGHHHCKSKIVSQKNQKNLCSSMLWSSRILYLNTWDRRIFLIFLPKAIFGMEE